MSRVCSLVSLAVRFPDISHSFINEHIQLDEGNQLRLRTHMTKEDIEKFRIT